MGYVDMPCDLRVCSVHSSAFTLEHMRGSPVLSEHVVIFPAGHETESSNLPPFWYVLMDFTY